MLVSTTTTKDLEATTACRGGSRLGRAAGVGPLSRTREQARPFAKFSLRYSVFTAAPSVGKEFKERNVAKLCFTPFTNHGHFLLGELAAASMLVTIHQRHLKVCWHKVLYNKHLDLLMYLLVSRHLAQVSIARARCHISPIRAL